MQVLKTSAGESAEYLKTLNDLIDQTIKLPVQAIQYYKNQWTVERMKTCFDHWIFLMAKENGKIGGIVLGTPVEGGVGTIIWVLVDPNCQKRGIGGMLLREAFNLYKLKGAHKVKLTVPDRKVVDFYLKQGMTVEGTHKNHWWNVDFWALGIQIN